MISSCSQSRSRKEFPTMKVCTRASICLLLPLILGASSSAATSGWSRVRLDADWRFRRDPENAPDGRGSFRWFWRPADGVTMDQASLPANMDQGDWRPAVVGRDVFRGRQGYAWYRTDLPPDPKGGKGVLHFESVDDNAAVFLNGVR